MNADEIKPSGQAATKTGSGVQGLIDLARRSLPETRREAETIEPVIDRRGPALLRRARERLDWTRLPGVGPRRPRPAERPLIRLLKRFGTFVVLPTALIAFYLFAIATDQWIAEAQFAVRGNVEPMEEVALGEFTGLIQKHNSQDSFIVRDYIQSRPMVSAVETSLHVSKMFAHEDADLWARYDGSPLVEELVRYWRRHVQVRIEALSGIITLQVRAFTPEDALAISRDVIARSETLVNDISRRAQGDMLAHAEADAEAAANRLRQSRVRMQEYRNRWGIIDPIKSATATLQTIELLRKDKMKAENDLRVLRGSNLDEKSRGIQVLVATVAATDAQMKELQDRLTTDGLATNASRNLTQALLEYEVLMVEQTVAEKLNESAHLMVDRARVGASKQQIYLATFVPPTLPTYSLYPRRGYALGIAFFCFFAVWCSISLILAGINDQRL